MSDQHQPFEQLKQIDENGMEFWSARSTRVGSKEAERQ